MLDFESVGGAEGMSYPHIPEVMQAGNNDYRLDVIRPKFEDYKREASRIATEALALEVRDDETLNIAVMLGGNAKKIAKNIDSQRKAIIAEPQDFVKGVNAICKSITDVLDEAERTAKAKISQHQARLEMERRKQEEAARKAAAELQEKLRREAEEMNRKAREEAARKAEEEIRTRLAQEAEEREKREAESKAEAEEREKREAAEIEAARKKAEEEAAAHAIEAPVVVTPVIPDVAPKTVRTEAAAAHQRKVMSFEIVNAEEVPREFMAVNEQAIRDAIKAGARTIPGVRIFEETKTVFRT